jgi:hypothetical protein
MKERMPEGMPEPLGQRDKISCAERLSLQGNCKGFDCGIEAEVDVVGSTNQRAGELVL